MPFLTSHTLILTHSLSCLTTSFLLLTSPSTLTASGPVWLLGEAMHIRDTLNFSHPSEPIATLALVLAVLAIVELIFSGGLVALTTIPTKPMAKQRRESEGGGARQSLQAFAEQAAIVHAVQGQWIIVSILKSLAFGILVLYVYLTSSRKPGMEVVYPLQTDRNGSTGFEMLKTRFVFAGLFIEMILWGYIWANLRDERTNLAARIKTRRDEAREDGSEGWNG